MPRALILGEALERPCYPLHTRIQTMPPDTITAAQFKALCGALWGEEWRREAAAVLGVGLRNVQFWSAEPPARGKPIPAGVIRDLFALIRGAMADPIRAAELDREASKAAEIAEILRVATALDRGPFRIHN